MTWVLLRSNMSREESLFITSSQRYSTFMLFMIALQFLLAFRNRYLKCPVVSIAFSRRCELLRRGCKLRSLSGAYFALTRESLTFPNLKLAKQNWTSGQTHWQSGWRKAWEIVAAQSPRGLTLSWHWLSFLFPLLHGMPLVYCGVSPKRSVYLCKETTLFQSQALCMNFLILRPNTLPLVIWFSSVEHSWYYRRGQVEHAFFALIPSCG